jgi:hypothetical protein
VSHDLQKLLSAVEVLEPQQTDGLAVFGLRWSLADGPAYATLDDALAAGTAEVTEISEGGSVPVLKLINRADTMVFLMAGEQLIGAKQNRVLNASVMAAARSELPIPVSCVEAGRWHYRSPKFLSGGTSSHGLLRKLLSQHAHDSYRTVGSPLSKQGEVWQEVARKLHGVGSASPSSALQQAYEDHAKRLTDLLGTVRVPEGCSGVAFALGGRVVGADLFDRAATLDRLFPKLLRAYALDALEAGDGAAAVTAAQVRQWLDGAARAKAEPFKSPGLGHDVRLEGDGVVGAALVVDERPVHVELFGG